MNEAPLTLTVKATQLDPALGGIPDGWDAWHLESELPFACVEFLVPGAPIEELAPIIYADRLRDWMQKVANEGSGS